MSQEISRAPKISFAVDDVSPATTRLPEIACVDALKRTVRTPVVACREPERAVVKDAEFHPLIAAAALAYQQHYPLILSPDMVWFTVLQGVAQHVNNNSETLRSRLVQHQTKIELAIDPGLAHLPSNDAEMLQTTKEFVERIAKHVQPDKQILFKTQFSTTTDVERIAQYIAVMDTFQPYFDYVMNIICGIPSVTLEGTPADWELLAARIKLLHDSDLELSWWTKHLLPLADHFVRASRGDVDRKHWKNLCKLIERYGVNDLNGWLLKFIPYVRHDENEAPIHRNPVLELTEFPDPAEEEKKKGGGITGCTPNMLPIGLSSAPVTVVNRETDSKDSYHFVAGLMGVTQTADLALRPIFGWAIAEGARIDRLIERLRIEHKLDPAEPRDIPAILRIFDHYLPADLWRFYTQTDGATIRFENKGNKHFHIHGLEYIKPVIDATSVVRELEFLYQQDLLAREDFTARREFAMNHRHLRAFAAGYDGKEHVTYLFGHDPEQFKDGEHRESRGEIFRWNGKLTPKSFEPVAHSFTEWLESMLEP